MTINLIDDLDEARKLTIVYADSENHLRAYLSSGLPIRFGIDSTEALIIELQNLLQKMRDQKHRMTEAFGD